MRIPVISPIFGFVEGNFFSALASTAPAAERAEKILSDRDRLAALKASAEKHGIVLAETDAARLALIDWATACRRADLDERTNVPPDLRSTQPIPVATADGSLLSLSLLPTDFTCGRKNPSLTGISALVLAFIAGVSGPMAFLPVALMGFSYLAGRRRAYLALQAREFPGDASRPTSLLLDQRRRQSTEAMRDTTPFLSLGKATGWLRRSNDFCCPDPGQEIGLTCDDLSRHMWVWGATGTGKTSGLMRPLVRQWAQKTRDGLLVLDGKGDLPREFVGAIPGYCLIDPSDKSTRVALLEGLAPEDVVVALSGHVQDTAGAADFWAESGKVFMFHVANLLEHLVETKSDRWTVARLAELVSSATALKRELSAFNGADLVEDEKLMRLRTTVPFLIDFCFDMPAETAGSIRATALSWLAPLMLSRDLSTWTNCSPREATCSVAEVLHGSRMGVSLPEFRFGVAGLAASRLIRATLYRCVKLRGSSDRWTPMERKTLLVIDEAALALSHAEAEIAPIARSLGLAMCCAAQNFEQIETRFRTNAAARALLDQFRSQVAFDSSVWTQQYVCERGGFAWLPKPDNKPIRDFRDASDGYRGLGLITGSSLNPLVLSGDHPSVSGRPTAIVGCVLSNPLDQPLPLCSGRAIAVLSRANAPRRDLFDTAPEFFNAR